MDIAMFLFFMQDVPQPTDYIIDKGVVTIVRSEEAFWIRYPKENEQDAKVSTGDGSLSVTANKDNIPFEINILALEKCSIRLQNGVVKAKNLCQKTQVSVGNGTILSFVPKSDIGSLKADVRVGILQNNSSLEKVSAPHGDQATNEPNFGGSSFLVKSVDLVGENADNFSSFYVDVGMINIE